MIILILEYIIKLNYTFTNDLKEQNIARMLYNIKQIDMCFITKCMNSKTKLYQGIIVTNTSEQCH